MIVFSLTMLRRSTLAVVMMLGCVTTLFGNDPAGALEGADGSRQALGWKNEKLLGFPDPPLPYQVIRAYPNLSFKKLLAAGRCPENGWMWTINHDGDYGGPGRIFIFRDEPEVRSADLLLEIPDIMYGVAFHPKFAENGYLYIGCNGHSDALGVVATKVIRVTLTGSAPYQCDIASAETIIEWPSNGHNGGDLVFGKDGLLYVTAGDGTSDSDGNLTGQDITNINGSVIRIDVDHASPGKGYSIPSGNPFSDIAGACPEIWAFGLRNPWRITYDSALDQLWVGNNGQDVWESVHLIRKGENYGWSINEGSHPFQLQRKQGPTPIVAPTIEHHHSEARSLTGGVVYRGKKWKELNGAYIYGDYSTGNIWAASHDGDKLVWQKQLARSSVQITGFGVDSSGELVIVDHAGAFYHLDLQPPRTDLPEFPVLLSDTGLFADLKNAQPHPNLIPYAVQSPLWSDGAKKQRLMAVPTGQSIDYTDVWGWNFPDETVLVKTFSLPLASSTGQIDERAETPIETRIMVKLAKEWYGYSYRWNDDQSDAVLVPSQGADVDFTVVRKSEKYDISDTAQTSIQKWRFPSRSECAVCHTRAANYVLGLSAAQLNRNYDYSHGTENQIEYLARIGILRFPDSASRKDADVSERDLATAMPKPIDELPRMVDPSDDSKPLEARVRSYLHSNCAHCHTNAGGGNSRMELEYHKPTDKTNIIAMDPQHHSFGIDAAKVIAPGKPDSSTLLRRISNREAGKMPPLSSSVVDPLGVEIIRQWIAEMQ